MQTGFEHSLPIRCDGCGAEITWAPLIRHAPHSLAVSYYCCRDCLGGRVCECGERLELGEERRKNGENVT